MLLFYLLSSNQGNGRACEAPEASFAINERCGKELIHLKLSAWAATVAVLPHFCLPFRKILSSYLHNFLFYYK